MLVEPIQGRGGERIPPDGFLHGLRALCDEQGWPGCHPSLDILPIISVVESQLHSGLDIRNWLAPPLNNARLVSLGLYEGNLSSFRTLMKDCDGDFECFYAQASALADLEFDQRQARLQELDSG